jgi:hypothetical protein
MRHPRFRFTIKTSMIGLAVAAIMTVGGYQAWCWFQWREGYLYAAEYHEEKEQSQRKTLEDLALGRSRGHADDPLFPIMEDLARRRLAFHSAMKKKWREAAARPWISVPEDPDTPTDDRIVKPFPPPAKYFTDDVKYFDPATVRTSTDVASP